MVFRGEKVVFGPNVQSGYGLGRFFRNVGRVFKPVVNPVLKEVKDIGLTVGTNLLQNVVQDVLTGQSPKASIKARGKQSRDKALQLTLQKSLQKQKGRGLFNMEVVKKKQKGKGIGRFWGKKSKTPANLKRKAILGKIGNAIKPILKETKGIVSNAGKDFLGNVIQDVIAGKNVKTALKARGKEAAIDATNMSIQRVLEKEIKKENSDLNEKGTKRKRNRSRSKSVSKKKRVKRSGTKRAKPVRKHNSTKKHGKNRNKREPIDIFSSSKQKGGMAEAIFSKRHGYG